MLSPTQDHKNSLSVNILSRKTSQVEMQRKDTKVRNSVQYVMGGGKNLCNFCISNSLVESMMWRRSMINPNTASTAQIVGVMNQKIYKLQDVKEIQSLYKKYRMLNASFAISILVPIILSVPAIDIQFTYPDSKSVDILLHACVWVTLVSIIINVMRYVWKFKYKKAINKISKESNFISSGQMLYLAVETLVLMVVPTPWTVDIILSGYNEDDGVSYTFHLNDVFGVIMMLRILFVLRVVFNMSRYMSPTAVRIGLFFGTKNSYTYALQCYMKQYPIRTLLINYFTSIIIFAYMIRVCERPLSLVPGYAGTMLISNYWNALWFVIATMTTVGYGDFYARTNFGRLVAFFCCTWGAVIISTMVVTVTSVLEMDASQKKILIIMERLHLRKRLKHIAADLIKSVAKFIYVKSRPKIDDSQLEYWKFKARKNLKKFKKLNARIKAMDDRENTNEEMSRQFEFMRYEMKEIKAAINNFSYLLQSQTRETHLFEANIETDKPVIN